MIGLAANPGTAVLPICLIARTSSPSAPLTRAASAMNNCGHRSSYGTTSIGKSCPISSGVMVSNVLIVVTSLYKYVPLHAVALLAPQETPLQAHRHLQQYAAPQDYRHYSGQQHSLVRWPNQYQSLDDSKNAVQDSSLQLMSQYKLCHAVVVLPLRSHEVLAKVGLSYHRERR